jgi:hypothetical protein
MVTVGPTHKVPRRIPTCDQRLAVYSYVTKRDKTCRAQTIDPWLSSSCQGDTERHHAGIKFGSNRNRLTDARHCVLICEFHHLTWAPSHSRLILDYLNRVENARDKARHDFEEGL